MKQLELILQKKTSGVLKNVKDRYERIITFLFFGTLANLMISPFLHWILGDEGPVLRMPPLLSLLTIVIAALGALFFYWKKYTSMAHIVNDRMQIALKEAVQGLKHSMRQEIAFLVGFFVIMFVLARSTSELNGNGVFWDIFRTDIMLALLAGALLIATAILVRVKHYRKHIKELEGYVSEFSES